MPKPVVKKSLERFFFTYNDAATIFMLSLLVMAIFTAYNGAKKEISLLVNGSQSQVHTFAENVDVLLQENDITLDEQDRVFPALTERLEDGMEVKVFRAVPVILQVGEEKKCQVTTSAQNVGEFLKDRDIVLGARDVVVPDVKTSLKSGLRIQVDRITAKIVEEDVPLSFQVERESDNTLFRGIIKLVKSGSNGLEHKKWEITLKNGKEVEKKLLASNIVIEPVNQVVKVGTLQTVSRGGGQIRFSKAFDMVATAYTHTGGNTSTGVKPYVGVVAVDPSVIPMGSRLYVEGYGYCQALDRGSNVKGRHVDVFLETKKQAQSWGRKRVKVYLLE